MYPVIHLFIHLFNVPCHIPTVRYKLWDESECGYPHMTLNNLLNEWLLPLPIIWFRKILINNESNIPIGPCILFCLSVTLEVKMICDPQKTEFTTKVIDPDFKGKNVSHL